MFSVTSIFEQRFDFSVQALAEVEITGFRRTEVKRQLALSPGLRTKWRDSVARQARVADELLVVPGQYSAEERIAYLILQLAPRVQETAQAVERLVGEELKEADVKAFYDPRVFIDFVSAIHDWRTAVVIVGPYQDPALYGKRAFSWIAKAYTLLARFERVFLILPSNADASQFRGWTESLRISDDRLRLAQLNANASTLKLDRADTFGVVSKHAR